MYGKERRSKKFTTFGVVFWNYFNEYCSFAPEINEKEWVRTLRENEYVCKYDDKRGRRRECPVSYPKEKCKEE